jgi:hypothetical protein
MNPDDNKLRFDMDVYIRRILRLPMNIAQSEGVLGFFRQTEPAYIDNDYAETVKQHLSPEVPEMASTPTSIRDDAKPRALTVMTNVLDHTWSPQSAPVDGASSPMKTRVRQSMISVFSRYDETYDSDNDDGSLSDGPWHYDATLVKRPSK